MEAEAPNEVTTAAGAVFPELRLTGRRGTPNNLPRALPAEAMRIPPTASQG
jgi:hypothetical protein